MAGGLIDGLRSHALFPDDAAVAVDLEVVLRRAACQLAQLLGGQAVGIVVRGEHDDGVLQHPRLGQTLQQQLHGILQLQLACDIGPHIVAVGQVCHQSLVLRCHGVAAEGELPVTGDGHVVDGEGGIAHIVAGGQVHDLDIRLRPLLRDLQPIAEALVVIAQVGQILVPVVIRICVTVVGVGAVAQFHQLLVHGQGHIVARGPLEAPDTVLGDGSRQMGIFAVGGADAPVGDVVIAEIEALVGQLVERRGPDGVHHQMGVGLGGDEDQVAALEHAGLLVLIGGRPAGKILVDLLNGIPVLSGDEGVEVDVENVGTGVVSGRRLRGLRGQGRGCGLRGRGPVLLRGQELVLPLGLIGSGGLDGHRITQIDRALRALSGQGPGHIQPEGREQPQLVDAQVSIGGVVVKPIGGGVLPAAQHGQRRDRQKLDHHRQRHQRCLLGEGGPALEPVPLPAAEEEQQQGRRHERQGQQILCDGRGDGRHELECSRAVGHGVEGVEGAEDPVIHQLAGAEQIAQEGIEQGHEEILPLPRQRRAHREQHRRRQDCENGAQQQTGIQQQIAALGGRQMEHQLRKGQGGEQMQQQGAVLALRLGRLLNGSSLFLHRGSLLPGGGPLLCRSRGLLLRRPGLLGAGRRADLLCGRCSSAFFLGGPIGRATIIGISGHGIASIREK